MKSKEAGVTQPTDVAARVLASALFAGDYCAVRQLFDPKSKLRRALEREVPQLIRREMERALLDPDGLAEADREAYEKTLQSVTERYGDQIQASPLQPPAALIGEIAEEALARGSYASAASALEHLGTKNQRVGELVASALRDLESADKSESAEVLGAGAAALTVAVKLKNPLEPLFQKRAVELHFSNPQLREKLFGAFLAASSREATDFCIDYLLGDTEIADGVRKVLSNNSTRQTFLRALAANLSGGEEAFSEFTSRYRASVEVFQSSKEKPDVAEVQRSLEGGPEELSDGIALLRSLAVAHPVSSLVCRVIPLPRGGHYLIPTIVEGKSALDILGIA